MDRPIKESVIQDRIRKALRANGYFVIRHQQNLGSHKGLSDLSAIRDGITYYIEIKTSTGKQSDYQLKFQADIEAHGAKYILARRVEDIASLCDRVQTLF